VKRQGGNGVKRGRDFSLGLLGPNWRSFVESDLVTAQDFAEFLLKANPPMMFGLILNVLRQHRGLRRTDRKAAVASLPGEAPNSLGFQPAGGMALKRFNDFGHLLGAGQTEKDPDTRLTRPLLTPKRFSRPRWCELRGP
jgi:hypothetical protein